VSRVAVITGVLGGIGRACAAKFRADGWDVAGIDRAGGQGDVALDHFAQLDVGKSGAGPELDRFFAEIGWIDALVNNAAILIPKALVDTTDDDWAETIASNLTGPFVATRAATPYLRKSRGSIVNVSSVHAVATSGGIAAYAATKGALLALTRAAALELGAHGVRVNAVLPGAVDTPMLRASSETRIGAVAGAPDPLEDIAARTPLGRIGRPEEIASAIVFLADGERSSFVTGQTLIVDGGVTVRLASE
jgi:NAD(P)-dependent dehydrogenase (short-subunit alcohol dehydrogenase family)